MGENIPALVERLRKCVGSPDDSPLTPFGEDVLEAADRVEALEAALGEAEAKRDEARGWIDQFRDNFDEGLRYAVTRAEKAEAAREALEAALGEAKTLLNMAANDAYERGDEDARHRYAKACNDIVHLLKARAAGYGTEG